MPAVFVMPLRRFLEGAWTFPKNAYLVEPTIAKSTAQQAADRVKALQADLRVAGAQPHDWTDEGAVALARAWDPGDLHAVRSLSAHLDYPRQTLGLRRPFTLLPDPRDSAALQRVFAGEPTRAPHLMRHSDNKGVWVPCEFEQPFVSRESAWWMIGSASKALHELEELRPAVAEVPDKAGGKALRDAYVRTLEVFGRANALGLPVIIA